MRGFLLKSSLPPRGLELLFDLEYPELGEDKLKELAAAKKKLVAK